MASNETSVSSIAVLRDCANRLDNLLKSDDVNAPETNVIIDSADNFFQVASRLSAHCKQIKSKCESITKDLDHLDFEADRVIKKNEIRQMIEEGEKILRNLRSLLDDKSQGITSIIRGIKPTSARELRERTREYKDSESVFQEAKNIAMKTIEPRPVPEESLSLKRSTLKKVVKGGPAAGYLESGVVVPEKNEKYDALLEEIDEKEALINKHIDTLILEARGLSDLGKNIQEEISGSTETVKHVTKKIGRSGFKMSTLNARVKRIINDRSMQSTFVTFLCAILFLALVGYLIYEILTFRKS